MSFSSSYDALSHLLALSFLVSVARRDFFAVLVYYFSLDSFTFMYFLSNFSFDLLLLPLNFFFFLLVFISMDRGAYI